MEYFSVLDWKIFKSFQPFACKTGNIECSHVTYKMKALHGLVFKLVKHAFDRLNFETIRIVTLHDFGVPFGFIMFL